ncbi:SAM-dependent methyltransferase [Chromobacterium paludis]|uniref:Class I SAM-dependent methyltransferase n=1 Tax=Chromobacterium paludis TaxID=2605945 RepID=A0A5C1DGY0_9NEIS|nr:class I SAM-dependent methyltransferase [Chromobacterium paludis]QEL56020.1 class I SAM-dependent methyltransferase [Chromobacterium paludis]
MTIHLRPTCRSGFSLSALRRHKRLGLRAAAPEAGRGDIIDAAEARPLRHAPDASQETLAFPELLRRLGYGIDDALRLKWQARDPRLARAYLDVYQGVIAGMRRQGPGSAASTGRAIAAALRHGRPERVLELACGNGEAALQLAEATGAAVVAIDQHPASLERLARAAASRGLATVTPRLADIAAPGEPPASFDLIWAEGCACLLGFERALRLWRPLLRPGGLLFVSEPVWLSTRPSAPARQLWRSGYPGMAGPARRENQLRAQGWDILDRFALPRADWDAYYEDMARQIAAAARDAGPDHPALADLRREIAVHQAHGGEYGQACWLLRPASR